ncbi:hypothetical protein RYX36_017814, partial [Vicia faba]
YLYPYCLFQQDMALEQTIKDIQIQNSQLEEMFLNLSKGQEEVRALVTRGMIMGNPEDDKDNQLEWLQTEIAIIKVQIMGQLRIYQARHANIASLATLAEAEFGHVKGSSSESQYLRS